MQTNRLILLSITLISIFVFTSFKGFAQNYNLTFRVDMSQQTLSPDGVHVAGDFQQQAGYASNWDPAATELTDADNDEIYEVTVSLPAGTYLYKFINGDDWGETAESPSSDCAIDDGNGNMNRQVVLPDQNRVLPVVMFDSCNAFVQFSVNMNQENVSAEGVHVMGNFQQAAGFSENWAPEAIAMQDLNSDNVYKAEVQMPPGNYQYVYVNGSTPVDAENPPADCTVDDGSGNRVRELNAEVGGMPEPTYTFNSCTIENTIPDYETHWWNDAVFYEIFVRSFKDSDGDGIGDFQGIIDQLDYLNDGDPSTTDDLGITGIWLMPMMESPSYHGYDATDYYATEPDYGTMADFEELVAEAHARGIKIILDLVMNHCSSQHPWFTQSANNENNYRDWFVWSDTDPGFSGPWGQDVWHYMNGSYYYGIFWSGMPDLNYSHEPVKTEMFNVAEYWLNKGVDGFRLDAIKYLDEDGNVVENTPETFQILEEFHDVYKGVNPDAFTVGEVWSGTESIVPYVSNDRLDVCFEFDLAGSIINSVQSSNPGAVETTFQNVQNNYARLQYATFLTNHDMDRVYSALGENNQDMKLAASAYLTMPGIPFVYYGEEVGMTGTGAHENIRRPMQWSANANAGFSTVTPWLALGDNYTTHNVADMETDPNSLLEYYKKLIHIRNGHTPLKRGYLLQVDNDNNNLLTYARIGEGEAVIVVSNYGTTDAEPYMSLAMSSLAAGNYAVTELMSGTTLDSLTINANGGFDSWQPGTAGVASKGTAIFYIKSGTGVGISNLATESEQFSIYPNPATEKVTISASNPVDGSMQVQVFDLNGKLLVQDKFNASKSTLNISSLKSGVYFIRCATLHHNEIKRLVVAE
ncbi:Alpha-amylase precursor [Salinivirga cyanobacteriivorans]|uniref:Alpha-amylase n=2 Tax=Salinivirga cyanobacteriivorans TaxID=1307839 RepID=A0A0S2I340_9BACT|nr:Alpha-amylase precursor [Salinivirga cyanobacteriivorans]